MAAIARPKLRENGGRPMNMKLSTPAASVASGKVPAPVRVRLKRFPVCPRMCCKTIFTTTMSNIDSRTSTSAQRRHSLKRTRIGRAVVNPWRKARTRYANRSVVRY
jgi:hypothetical protein